MPSNLSMLSDNFPAFTGRETTEEKVETIQDYLFQLLENLRYSLGNLDEDNFNEGGLEGLAQIITKPIVLQLGEMGEGMTSLSATIDGITTRVDDIEGNYTTITQTSEGLILKAGNDDSKAYVVVTQEGLNSAVSGLVTDGELSQAVSSGITQTMNSITMQVVSSESGTYMTMTDGNFTITSPNVDLHVDALNVHGEIYADGINAYSAIKSPYIYSPNEQIRMEMSDSGGIVISEDDSGYFRQILSLYGGTTGEAFLSAYDYFGNSANVIIKPNVPGVMISPNLLLTAKTTMSVNLNGTWYSQEVGGFGSSLPSGGTYGQVFFVI